MKGKAASWAVSCITAVAVLAPAAMAGTLEDASGDASWQRQGIAVEQALRAPRGDGGAQTVEAFASAAATGTLALPAALAGEYTLALVETNYDGNGSMQPPQTIHVTVAVNGRSIQFTTDLTNYNSAALSLPAVDFYELPNSTARWLILASNPSQVRTSYTFDDGDRQADSARANESVTFTFDYRTAASPVLRAHVNNRPASHTKYNTVYWLGGDRYTPKPWIWFTGLHSAGYQGVRN